MKYKIYKLLHNNEVIYIGITKQKLYQRKGKKHPGIPIEIKKESSIELIEETDDKSRERYWIAYYKEKGYNLYNILKGDTGLDRKTAFKKWQDDNKDYLKEYNKLYVENNKEKIKEYQKEYRDKNPEYMKEWLEKNKEKIKEYQKEYYQKKKLLQN